MGKPFFNRLIKVLLWTTGIWAAALAILQFALSPAILGKAVNRFADEYIDAELKFEKVKIDMFRHFPNVGLILESGSLTYPADRFDDCEAAAVQGRLMYHGCGETADTLASFRHFSIGLNMGSLLTGKISIPHLLLVKPRIFLHSYDEANANWNIFMTGEPGAETAAEASPAAKEGTKSSLPRISLGRIRLINHPHIIYTDCKDTLFTMIDVKRIAFDGRLDTKKSARNRLGLYMDTVRVAGRMAADTIGLGMDMLHIHEHKNHMDIHAEAKTFLATRAFGRMNIPIKVKGTAEFPKDTVPTIILDGFRAEIAAVPIDFDVTLRGRGEDMEADGKVRIDNCMAEDIIDGFLKNIIPAAKEVRTDASLSLSATCRGKIGGGKLPAVDAVLTIPDSKASHRNFGREINLALKAGVKTDADNRFNLTVSNAEVSTLGLDINVRGDVSDILGEDPLVNLDGRFRACADSLAALIPEDSGISATGELQMDLRGKIRLSQMNLYNFGSAELYGSASCDNLAFKSTKDTVDVAVSGMAMEMKPENNMLGVSGNIGNASISLKRAIYAKGYNVSFSAKNSIDLLTDTTSKKVHPLEGHLTAAELKLEDSNGMSLSLTGTNNGFKMVPKPENHEIPVLTLSSDSKRIYLKDESNRIILTDADIKAEAAMNSVVLAHPEIPRDSLMSRMRARRRTAEIPEWMKEEDFRSKDLNFSLDGMLADYFRKWDLKGSVDIRTGILMTPKLPLRNIIKGIDVNFTNNEIRIDTIRMIAGASEIAASGSVTGLRRALLGRGIYKVNLDLGSGKMDAAEFLAAVNAGTTASTEGLSDVSDAEFLKMVVADSLETENINPLIIVPSDINATIRLNAGNISFADLMIDELTSNIIMKERCMQITETKAVTNMGSCDFEAFYSTRSKKNLRTGFNMSLKDVTSEKVIAMMPAIDTLMPLLKSFKGRISCLFAATSALDTCMNLIPSTINGVMRIEGDNLTMSDNQIFTDLAKKLKFRNKDKAEIDKMTVEGTIGDSTVEIFPFVLELDRYTLALSGIQNLDLSYRYHASIIRSPIIFKLGVDVYGEDFDNMKLRIGKPKYKNTKVPVFSEVIDQARVNLGESIRNIFEKGVEIAIRENDMQKEISSHKTTIGYVNAADQELEELSAEEEKLLEEEQERIESGVVDSTSITRTINQIISKEMTEHE